MKTDNLDIKIYRWSLRIGILYLFFILCAVGFYSGFQIAGLKAGINDFGWQILKSTPFLYHFIISLFIICIMSFVILAHNLHPFHKDNIQKNNTTDVILFSFLTLGFCGFVWALPMVYLWILLLKKIKQNKKEQEEKEELLDSKKD